MREMNVNHQTGEPRKFDVTRKGYRYWATLERRLSDGKPQLRFWSSHKWPFYHGNYTPDVLEREDAWQHFIDWIPE